MSLRKMLVEEHAGIVLYRSEYNQYFHTDSKLFPATEFLVEVLQHLPDAGTRLAPEGWQNDHQPQPALRLGPASQDTLDQSVSAKESCSAWARLLAKIYDVDVLRCARCGSPMRVLAVITDPRQVLRILRHLIKTGAAPLQPAAALAQREATELDAASLG